MYLTENVSTAETLLDHTELILYSREVTPGVSSPAKSDCAGLKGANSEVVLCT